MRLFRFLPVLILSTLPACHRDTRSVVGVVPKGANHVFWQSVHAGAIKASQEMGFQIEWNAPTMEIDSNRQIEIVESMINRHLAGIVLAPVDKKALVNVVERAARENIPVAIFDSGIDTDKRLTYVATNNDEGGRLAARRIGEVLKGKGKVAVIGFMPGSASTMEREDGFKDELQKKFPTIEQVQLQYSMGDRAKAMSQTENILTAHPDLAGLFASNESSTVGAVQAVKGRNNHTVQLVGFDSTDQLVADSKAGWIDSLVVQDPFRMGYESTRAIGLKLAGQPVAPHVDSGVRIVLRDQLEQPDVKALLFPDLKRWLNSN